MSLRVQILCDNQALPGFHSEHGFSALLTLEHDHVLFDAGQSEHVLQENARTLHAHLDHLKAIVLSHGHYDHGSGLAPVLKNNPDAMLHIVHGYDIERFSLRHGVVPKPIGLPQPVRDAIAMHRKVHCATVPTRILPSVWCSGPIPPGLDQEAPEREFLFLDACGNSPDPVRDEQLLWVETPQGAVVITGCSHSGLAHSLLYLARIRKYGPIRAIIGGFHLSQANEPYLLDLLTALTKYGNPTLVPCHCTGSFTIQWLAAHYAGTLIPGAAGVELEY